MRRPDDQEMPERPRDAVSDPTEVPVRDQIEIERRISDLARHFLNVAPGDFEACMREGLATVAELADADRARFVVVSASPIGLSEQYQWCAAAMPSRPEIADWKREVAKFRWSAKQLVSGEVLHLPRIAELPPEAAAERESLLADGVTAYLGLPILHEGRAVAFLDFARGPRPRERDGWEPAAISRLRLVAEVFGAAVRRLHLERELARQLQVERRVSA